MIGKLVGWIVGREPVLASTGLAAVVTALAGVLTAFDVVELTAEQIAALGALAAAAAGWAGRSRVTPVPQTPSSPEGGGIPLAMIILLVLVFLTLGGLFASCDAVWDDEGEEGDLGAPALVLDHDCYEYGDCGDNYSPGPEEDYGQDYSSRDRNRNRGRNRGAFSPGPFDRSPIEMRDVCISLDCSGRERRDDRSADEESAA